MLSRREGKIYISATCVLPRGKNIQSPLRKRSLGDCIRKRVAPIPKRVPRKVPTTKSLLVSQSVAGGITPYYRGKAVRLKGKSNLVLSGRDWCSLIRQGWEKVLIRAESCTPITIRGERRRRRLAKGYVLTSTF